jgi:hypothetical protein
MQRLVSDIMRLIGKVESWQDCQFDPNEKAPFIIERKESIQEEVSPFLNTLMMLFRWI